MGLPNIYPGARYIRVGGIVVDENENLWVTCSEVANSLTVRLANGQWKGFQFTSNPSIVNKPLTSKVIADKNGTKWVILTKGLGLFVYNRKWYF